jgi:hypothetical protein
VPAFVSAQDSLSRFGAEGYFYLVRGAPRALTPRLDRLYLAVTKEDDASIPSTRNRDHTELARYSTQGGYINNFLYLGPVGAQRWIPRPYPSCGVDPFGFDLFCSQNKPAPGCAP